MTGPRTGASRENAFFGKPGENTNIAPVVYQSDPAASSAGWNEGTRMAQLKRDTRLGFWPKGDGDWQKLRGLFMARAREVAEEDHEYRFGHYSRSTRTSRTRTCGSRIGPT